MKHPEIARQCRCALANLEPVDRFFIDNGMLTPEWAKVQEAMERIKEVEKWAREKWNNTKT